MNNKIDNKNKFKFAKQTDSESLKIKEKRYQDLLDAEEKPVSKSEEQLKREIYKQIKEKQQPLYLTLEYDDMLNDICRNKSTTKTIQLRKYVEESIRKDHKNIIK
jgi:hypothetical protein